MSMSRISAVAFAAAVLAATGAYAMTKMSDREALYVGKGGNHGVVGVTDAGHDNIMKNARALEAGAIIYRSGGKLYVLEDKKMTSGKMMFDETEAWFQRPVGGFN